VRRRALLGTAAAATLAGCSVARRPIEVVTTLSGTELDTFRQTVRDFETSEERAGKATYPVQVVVATGNSVDPLLQARMRAGNPPDAAVISEPALIAKYASRGRLVPLDRDNGNDAPRSWRELATWNGRLYGYWLKAAHKSLLWHRPGTNLNLDTWSDLMTAAGQRGTPLLSVGAADGWVLTDWLANLLAALAGADGYRRLAEGRSGWRGRQVGEALSRLGELWSTPGLFPGGPRQAVLTSFDGSVVDVFGTGQAHLMYEGDFVMPVITQRLGLAPGSAAAVPFPGVTGGDRPLVVGGDMIVALSSRDEVIGLLDYLVTGEARKRWVDAGFLVPSTTIASAQYPTALSRRLAEQLTGREATPLFGLTDLLTGGLYGDDGKGSWLIMQDFFRDVTGGWRIGRAVATAQDAFDAAARRRA